MICENCEESAYVIDKLAKLLAEIAVIVNGPEPPLTSWSYHDLPEKVRALKQAQKPAAAVPADDAIDAQELETAKIGAIEAAERRGFERGLAAWKPDRIWQDRNGALRTSPADCQSFGADGRPIAVYYGSQRFPISQHPLTDEETSHD